MEKRVFSLRKPLATLIVMVLVFSLGGAQLWADDSSSLSFMVVDEEGDPIPNTEFTLTADAPADANAVKSFKATSDFEGMVTFADVPVPGNFILSGTYNGQEYSATIQVDGNLDTATLQKNNTNNTNDSGTNVNDTAKANLTFTVVDKNGTPVSGVEIVLIYPDNGSYFIVGDSYSTKSDAKGVVTFTNIPIGKVMVFISNKSGNIPLGEIEVVAGDNVLPEKTLPDHSYGIDDGSNDDQGGDDVKGGDDTKGSDDAKGGDDVKGSDDVKGGDDVKGSGDVKGGNDVKGNVDDQNNGSDVKTDKADKTANVTLDTNITPLVPIAGV